MESEQLVFQHHQKQVYISKEIGFVLFAGCSDIDDINESLNSFTQ